MTDAPAVPPRLLWIAKANIILGIVCLVRLVPELVTVSLMTGRGPHWQYLMLLGLDILVGALWLRAGLVLRKRPGQDFAFAVFACALVLAHSIVSGWFLGRILLRDLTRVVPPLDSSGASSRDLVAMGLSGSRLLIYGIEFICQPFLLILLRRSAAGADRSSGRGFVMALVGWFLVGVVVQYIYIGALMTR